MPSGGYNKKDQELINKGYTTVNEMAKEFGRNRASIVTVLKYLGIKSTEIIGKHLFYTQFDKEQVAEFYEEHKDDFPKFLASEMRKRKNGGNGYSKERSDKIHKTKVEKYGENYGRVAYEKAWETCDKLYGDKNYRNKEKMQETLHKNRLKYCEENDCSLFTEIFGTSIDHSRKTLDFCMDNLGIKLINYKTVLYIKNEDIEPLKKELEKVVYNHTSISEKEISDFIKSICNYEILENDRNIISPKELDIYIPQKNLAIEFDGLYFHSTKFGKDSDYHLGKTLACEEKGIRLIHIFEDEWLFKRQIVESIIKSALGIYKQKIFARKCEVKKIDDKTFRNFCNENHIQGECSSSERIGLFYENELVQAVGFCKSRFSKNEIELVRMVTKINVQVVGGFSRLMKHFGKDCISYIDRRLFNGKGYKSSGFEYVCTNRPNYYYVKELDRYYRMNFTKKNIAKKFPNEFDESLTEEQNMEKLGFYRMYDCGTIKVKYKGNQK